MIRPRKRWLLYLLALMVPHVMLIIGIIMLSASGDPDKKQIGGRLINLSIMVLALGFFIYYIIYTPFFGMD